MFELPEHLSSLNALAPSPSSSAMDQSAEDAVWNYLNTDELFRNFGVQPSEVTSPKFDVSPNDQESSAPAQSPSDLKSFIAKFANYPQEQQPEFNVPLASLGSYGDASTVAPTPAGVNTSEVMPRLDASSFLEGSDDKPSGAKKLKQLGAGQAEIEEDKKRRNTEASARFRAKKKEREQNLERRAKDLETQVAQLTADKTSLENENRLLKAIVLGGNGGQGSAASDAIAQLVGKRKRD